MRRSARGLFTLLAVLAAGLPAGARAETRTSVPSVSAPVAGEGRGVLPARVEGYRLRCATCEGGADGMPVAAVKSQPRLEGLVLGGFAASTSLGILAALWAGFGTLIRQELLFNVGFAALVLSTVQFAATFTASFLDASRGPQEDAWTDAGRRRLQSMWPLALVFPGLAHLLSGRTAHGLWVLDLFGAGLTLAALSPVLLAAGGGAVAIAALLGFAVSAVVWVGSFLDAATAGGILNFLPTFEDAGGGSGAFAAAAAEEQRRRARPTTAW